MLAIPFLETEARLTVANRRQKTLPQGRLHHPFVEVLLQIAVLWVVASLPSSLMSFRTALPSPRRSALSSVLRVSPFPLSLAVLEMKDWSLSNLLLIAVMSPFGVGPEAAAAADAAVEEEEDVDGTVSPCRSDTRRRDEMGVAMPPGPVWRSQAPQPTWPSSRRWP